MPTIWQIGDKIQSRWEIYKILRGGMGIVYIVYDHEFREAFAVKTFQDEVFSHNHQIADRFTQEALAWIELDIHQNITQARFIEKIEGKPYLFLEYVSGGDLGSWIGTPRLTENLPQVLHFAIQFCDGMMHALPKGIKAHRDIKPQNCLITEDRILKVTDFGLAKVFDDVDSGHEPLLNVHRVRGDLSHTGTAAGTCTHMAPEQFDDAKHVDVRADIYSFGVMLFQMVMGWLPFIGRTWHEFEHLHKIQPAPRLENIPTNLHIIIETCLAKNPDQRFANFDIIRERLAELYQTLTGESIPTPVEKPELDAIHWSNKGASLVNLGRNEEALINHEHALAINPNSEQAWTNKGAVLAALGQFEEAMACYNQALALNPNFAEGWNNKGAALGTLGSHEEAIVCYDRALALISKEPEVWTNKGAALGVLGRYQEAIACHDHALSLNPRFEKAWTNKGVVLGALGLVKKEIACYERALLLNPNYDQAWYNKGIALKELGKYKEAVNCYNQAIALNQKFVQAWFNKGTLLVNEFQNYREALLCFEKANQLGVPYAGQKIELCKRMMEKE